MLTCGGVLILTTNGFNSRIARVSCPLHCVRPTPSVPSNPGNRKRSVFTLMIQIPSMHYCALFVCSAQFHCIPLIPASPRGFCRCSQFSLEHCETTRVLSLKREMRQSSSSACPNPPQPRSLNLALLCFLIQTAPLNFLMARHLPSHSQLSSLQHRSCGKDGMGAMATSSPRWALLECT